MAAFRDVYTEYYDNGLKYEFITEIKPGIWRISCKSDRMEYLAQDVTDKLFITDVDEGTRQLTDYGRLFAPGGHNLLQQVKRVLNHQNLVSLVDCFALQFSDSGKLGRDQWFTVWDYCDAGNLGNLLVPEGLHLRNPAPSPKPGPGPGPGPGGADEDVNMEDASLEPKFLPESFCWHVLVSVLRALTWLHDGVRDVVSDSGVWERKDENPDWQPMLHRNIHPRHIFVGYPRRKEWYGPVKLGNYGRLVVSGHCQTPGDKHVPDFTKAIGPPPGQKFSPLEDLVTYDSTYGSLYPHQDNQPYTMVSEYRAVGEIMQGMMVEPTGSKHLRRIQSKSVRENLRDTNYSGRLKNFVVKLMEFDPWRKLSMRPQPLPLYVTSDLYREAKQGFEWFVRSGSDEAAAFVTPSMAETDDYLEHGEIKAAEVFDSFQNVQEILEQFTDD